MADAPAPVSAPAATRRTIAGVPAWIWWLLAAVTVVTTAAGVTLSVTAMTALQNMPRTLVAHYLGELQHGRAESAMKLAGIQANSGDVLLNDAAYAKITDRISSFSLRPPVTRKGTTTVEAVITQGDRHYVRSFAVEQVGGLPGLPLWRLGRIQPDAVDLTVEGPAGIGYTVAGAKPKSAPIGTAITLRALPGTYPVKFTSSSTEYQVWNADVTSIQAGGAMIPTTFTARLTSTGDADARKVVDAWLDGCVASTDAAPKNCPFYTFAEEPGVAIADVHWRLDTRPSVDLEPVWTLGGWAVLSDTGTVTGEADLTRASDGATGTGSTDPLAFSFGGIITFDGGTPVFKPVFTDGSAPGPSGA